MTAERGAAASPSLITALGLRIVERAADRLVMEMPYSAAAVQPLGLFHAGAILSLADTAATSLLRFALAERDGVDPDALDPATFPLGIQVSGNILRARRDCTLRAESVPLHVGRSTAVIETKVRDEGGAVVAAVTTTHFLPGGLSAGG